MKYKIISDSSCDLLNHSIDDDMIEFKVVPLTIRVHEKEYVDDDDLNVDEMMEQVEHHHLRTGTSCPAPGVFEAQCDGEYNFIVTITSKMSGTYNSAKVACEMSDNKCFVIDSLGTCGMLELIINHLKELIHKELSYEEICKEIIEYRNSLNLYFVLEKFDNLVKNGRMSLVMAKLASLFRIKPLCKAVDGEIKLIDKPRTRTLAYKQLVEKMQIDGKKYEDCNCIISYCLNREVADQMKELLESNFSFKSLVVRKMKGLSSYYSLKNGLIVTFD